MWSFYRFTTGDLMSNEEINLPKNSAFLSSKKDDAKNKFSTVIEDFKKILTDKIHPDNQTKAYHNNVKSILERLLVSANELDGFSQGEGMYGLMVLSLRSSLKMKDELIKAEVRLNNLENELRKLRK
jgi:hypothetical protein